MRDKIAAWVGGALSALLLCVPPGAGAAARKPARSMISDGERAAASWAVQNLVSRHDYMHSVDRNMEEIEMDWVSPTGPYAATAAFSSPDWALYGMSTIVSAYGELTKKGDLVRLHELSLVDPNVKDAPENFGAGNNVYLHTNTTPIIEIAGDGRSAQGLWYTPGLDVMPIVQDGKIHIKATLSFQKLGADFVKEDGQWKIWHMMVAFDVNPPLPEEMLKPIADGLGNLYSREELKPVAGGVPRMPADIKKGDYIYPRYSPQRPGILWPKLPMPYYSFSEKSVVSNCNCKQELPAILMSAAK